MSLEVVSIVGVVVLVALTVLYLKLRRKDQIGAMIDKRKGTAKLVSRADYVEGREEMPVALSLTADTFYYENPDLEASFDLNRIDEVEYADDLATGHEIRHTGVRVLRLRSHGAVFEFLLEKGDCDKWMAALPPRTYGSSASAQAV
jgi:hypothetical protein